MITIVARLEEFISATPVIGADVEVTVKVVPRWELAKLPGPEVGNNPTHLQHTRIDEDGESLSQWTISGAGGISSCSFDINEAFHRQRRARIEVPVPGSPTSEPRPPDEVVARFSVRARLAGLDSTVGPFLLPDPEEALVGHQRVEQKVVLDFAKAIVGHTTSESVALWFCHHGLILPGHSYVCEIDEKIPSERGETAASPSALQPVIFDPKRANTATLEFIHLKPATNYTFRLRFREFPAGKQNSETTTEEAAKTQILAEGGFVTAPADPNRLRLVFGSCHTPTTERSLERWQALAENRDYDLMLLMGDQIYEHGLEGDTEEAWFKEYVKRYHQYWAYKPMREVLRSTPTYMTLDDHEIMDDWGSPLPSGGSPQTVNTVSPDVRHRFNGAIRAYRAFQHAHNPGGTSPSSPIYYSFHRGPAAFFVADSRTVRGTEVRNDPIESFPILGKEQFAAMEEWARSRETQQADVVFFIAAVPLALLSLAELERFNEKLKEDLKSAVGTGATLLDAWVAGPVGPGTGYISGREIVEEAFEWQIVEEDLSTTYNMNDQWVSEQNQPDLTRVLDLLFELANEPHSRAVFVLSGDSHMGAMHVISSRKPEHRRNTAIYQIISSPISRESPAEKLIERYTKAIPAAPVHELLKSLSGAPIASSVADQTPDEMGMRFPLDHHADPEPSNYKAQLLGLRATRNFGRIELERVRNDRRVYRFRLSIRGQVASLAYDMELDLDDQLVTPRGIAPNDIVSTVVSG